MTVRLSVAVMAHRKREQFIPGLLEKLDRPATVVWDRRDDRWDTGRRAWQAVDRSATHGLVLQDDAILCRDLVAGVERALQDVPPDVPLCLYCGRVRPYRDLVQQLVNQATGATSWLTMGVLNWGPGIVLPTKWIDEMVAWGDTRPDVPNYDKRISRWLGHQGIRIYYPWPSLVDHRTGPSLIPGRSAVRRAHWFIGENASALDCRWDGGVVSIPALEKIIPHVSRHRPVAEPPRTRRPRLGVAVKFVSTKYPQLLVPTARVRFRDGKAETRDPDAVAVLLSSKVASLGVSRADAGEPDAESESAPNGNTPAAEAVPLTPPADSGMAPSPAAESTPLGVPDGTAGDVLAWVGDDPDRARQALDAEQVRDKPRSSLVTRLEKTAGRPGRRVAGTATATLPAMTAGNAEGDANG